LQGERQEPSAAPEVEHIHVMREGELTCDLARHGSSQLYPPRLLVPCGRGLIEAIGV
jgi:hypothetical protein